MSESGDVRGGDAGFLSRHHLERTSSGNDSSSNSNDNNRNTSTETTHNTSAAATARFFAMNKTMKASNKGDLEDQESRKRKANDLSGGEEVARPEDVMGLPAAQQKLSPSAPPAKAFFFSKRSKQHSDDSPGASTTRKVSDAAATEEVIDLCDDSDNDDEQQATPSTKKTFGDGVMKKLNMTLASTKKKKNGGRVQQKQKRFFFLKAATKDNVFAATHPTADSESAPGTNNPAPAANSSSPLPADRKVARFTTTKEHFGDALVSVREYCKMNSPMTATIRIRDKPTPPDSERSPKVTLQVFGQETNPNPNKDAMEAVDHTSGTSTSKELEPAENETPCEKEKVGNDSPSFSWGGGILLPEKHSRPEISEKAGEDSTTEHPAEDVVHVTSPPSLPPRLEEDTETADDTENTKPSQDGDGNIENHSGERAPEEACTQDVVEDEQIDDEQVDEDMIQSEEVEQMQTAEKGTQHGEDMSMENDGRGGCLVAMSIFDNEQSVVNETGISYTRLLPLIVPVIVVVGLLRIAGLKSTSNAILIGCLRAAIQLSVLGAATAYVMKAEKSQPGILLCASVAMTAVAASEVVSRSKYTYDGQYFHVFSIMSIMVLSTIVVVILTALCTVLTIMFSSILMIGSAFDKNEIFEPSSFVRGQKKGLLSLVLWLWSAASGATDEPGFFTPQIVHQDGADYMNASCSSPRSSMLFSSAGLSSEDAPDLFEISGFVLEGVGEFDSDETSLEEEVLSVRLGDMVELNGEDGPTKDRFVRALSGFYSGFRGDMNLEGALRNESRVWYWRKQIHLLPRARVQMPGTPIQFMKRIAAFRSWSKDTQYDAEERARRLIHGVSDYMLNWGMDLDNLNREWDALTDEVAYMVLLSTALTSRPKLLLVEQYTPGSMYANEVVLESLREFAVERQGSVIHFSSQDDDDDLVVE
ncbi:MAG: hypothetical protein SGILL_002176 [Bacillariaceae sp.]